MQMNHKTAFNSILYFNFKKILPVFLFAPTNLVKYKHNKSINKETTLNKIKHITIKQMKITSKTTLKKVVFIVFN